MSDDSDDEGVARSKVIDDWAYRSHKNEKDIHKILLIGTGESGKSTIFKQMRVLYDKENISEDDNYVTKMVVRRNIIDCLQTLIAGVEKFELKYERPESKFAALYISELEVNGSEGFPWNDTITQHADHLWNNEPAIRACYAQRSRLQLYDSCAYMLDSLQRISQRDYVPDTDDFVRARLRTSGIIEKLFNIQNVKFKFIDVGGQRSERRKWIHCFHDVTALIYVAACSEFDQRCYEDETSNRMEESLQVWSAVVNYEVFGPKCAFILFLNKSDIFEEKILRMGISLSTFFDDFKGPDTLEASKEFILDQFMRCNESEREIFPHFTCATDTTHIEEVFGDCQQMILKININEMGLGDY